MSSPKGDGGPQIIVVEREPISGSKGPNYESMIPSPEGEGGGHYETPLEGQCRISSLKETGEEPRKINEEEYDVLVVPKTQGPQGAKEVLPSPFADHLASPSLGTRFLDLVRKSSPRQLSRMEAWLENYADDDKGNWTLVKRKKSRDPSPVSPIGTRNRVKVDVGAKIKTPGRKILSQSIQEEAGRNVVNGSQTTIKDVCLIKKK